MMIDHFRHRGRAILKEKGLGSLLLSVCKRVRHKPGWHILKVLELIPTPDLKLQRPGVEVIIRELDDPDDPLFDEIVAKDVWRTSKTELMKWIQEGQRCYVAVHQGRLSTVTWWQRGEFLVPQLHRRFKLAPNEVYCHNAFTVPEYRGKGIWPYLKLMVARQFARTERNLCVLALVHSSNRASLHGNAKLGTALKGHVGFAEIFGIRLHYMLGRSYFRDTHRRIYLEFH